MKKISLIIFIYLGLFNLYSNEVKHFIYYVRDNDKIYTDSALLNPKIYGAQIMYVWRQLEPEKDKYDFSEIEKDLNFLSSKGKKLFIQLQINSFVTTNKPVPKYISDDMDGLAYQYSFTDDEKDTGAKPFGYITKVFEAPIMERYQKLLKELGKKFDGKIEGINLGETAIDIGETGKYWPKGFTYEANLLAMMSNMKVLSMSFPNSVAMIYANFIPGDFGNEKGYMSRVYDLAKSLKLGVGGPDLFPYKKSHQLNSYPFIKNYPNYLPKALAVQEGNLDYINPKTNKKVSLKDIMDFGLNYLGLNYIFWYSDEPYFSKIILPNL